MVFERPFTYILSKRLTDIAFVCKILSYLFCYINISVIANDGFMFRYFFRGVFTIITRPPPFSIEPHESKSLAYSGDIVTENKEAWYLHVSSHPSFHDRRGREANRISVLYNS